MQLEQIFDIEKSYILMEENLKKLEENSTTLNLLQKTITKEKLENLDISNNIYVLGEIFTNGYKDEFLLFLSLISIFLAILVIIAKNPIISVLFLIGLFMGISFYLIFLGLNFLGISYLLVYIGAVSILFLFILMLINVRVSELLSETYNSIVLSLLITIYFSFTLNQIMPYNITGSNNMYNFIHKKNEFNIEIFSLKRNNTNEIFYTSFET
jgi:NADH-ubiquinone oxidoreductase chain 6